MVTVGIYRAAAPSIAASIGAGLLLCGCPNPNAYTVPRTLEPGDLQFDVAAEVYALSANVSTASTSGGVASTSRYTTATPEFPTVGIRYGLVDGVDLGARLENLQSLAGDAKVRLLRGRLDLAFDPGFQFMDVTGTISAPDQHVPVLYLHAPLLVGVNLSDTVTLVAAPGFAYSFEAGTLTGTTVSVWQTGPWARFGLGVDIRTSATFALHPEVTCMKGFGSSETIYCVAGLGGIIGAQPSYADLSEPQAP
jgi:hypothetical protein